MEDPSRMEEMPVDVDMVHLGTHYAGEALRSLANFQSKIALSSIGRDQNQLAALRRIDDLASSLDQHAWNLRQCAADAVARSERLRGTGATP